MIVVIEMDVGRRRGKWFNWRPTWFAGRLQPVLFPPEIVHRCSPVQHSSFIIHRSLSTPRPGFFSSCDRMISLQ